MKIVIARFLIIAEFEQQRWFDLKRGQYLQGLLAEARGERRVYFVTVPAPVEYG